MRLTIIPVDTLVSINANPVNLSQSKDKDGNPLDITTCNIPDNVHALQWYGNRGWIEFKDSDDPFTPKQTNEEITELPEWANACVNLYNSYPKPTININTGEVIDSTSPAVERLAPPINQSS